MAYRLPWGCAFALWCCDEKTEAICRGFPPSAQALLQQPRQPAPSLSPRRRRRRRLFIGPWRRTTFLNGLKPPPRKSPERPVSSRSRHGPARCSGHRSRRVVKRWRCNSLRPARHRRPQHKVYQCALVLTPAPAYIQQRQQQSLLRLIKTKLVPTARKFTGLSAEP